MNRLRQAFLGCILAALAGFFLLAAPVAAQAPPIITNPPYTFQTNGNILDGTKTLFSPYDFGCGFNASTNNFILAADDSAATPSLQHYCDRNEDGTPEPADFYWKDGASQWIVATGDRAAARNEPANSIPNGSTAALLFSYLAGSAPRDFTNITIENAGAPGTTGSNAAIDFEGNCRQQAGELSWIVCPVLNFATEIISGTIKYVLEFLKPEPLLLGSSRGTYLHDAWKQFLTIANVMLIPIFLIAIYFMLTSSNQAYSVARLLPRLVVAVLLMQVSFYIAAIIIDIGNIMAAGIAGIFNSINAGIDSSAASAAIGHLSPELGGSGLDRGVGAAVGGGLAISAGALIFVTGALPPLILLIVTFLIGIVITFIALALRQLAIVVFVVLGPMAMLLGVLPSTEKWMKEWFDNTIKLVLIYPVLVLFFSAASTLSRLSLASGTTGEVNQIVAASLPIVTLISTPLLIQLAGRLFRGVTSYVSGIGGKAKGGILGDPKNDQSLAYNARKNQAVRSQVRSERLANVAGLGWTAAVTRPFVKTKTRYGLASGPLKDLFISTNPDPLKRLFWGDQPFDSFNGTANYTANDLNKTNGLRYDIGRYRRMLTELAILGSGELATFAGGAPDNALNTMFGIGGQYGNGMSPDAATTAFDSLKGPLGRSQLYTGSFTIDDARNDWVQAPGANGRRSAGRLYEFGYGDYRALPGQYQGRNLEIKQNFLGKAAGMMSEGASEMTFRAAGDSLRDDRVRSRYVALAAQERARLSEEDRRFRDQMDALLNKGVGIGRGLQERVGPDDLVRMAGMREEDRAGVYVGGGYNKSGTEIMRMYDFADQARQIQEQAEAARAAAGLI